MTNQRSAGRVNHSVWIALGILVLFAALMVGVFTDLERHRRQIERENELDLLWGDEVGADGALLWASSGTVSADDLFGGAA